MAYLRTLEGVEATATGAGLEDLFNCNDSIGVMLFGVDAWNKIKNYAANRALELLASKSDFYSNLRKIGGRKKYVVTNDILEKAFGFNHCLGVELCGAEEWNEFVLDCKTYTPPEYCGQMNGIGDFISALVSPAGKLYPETMSPAGILQWTLAPGTTMISDLQYALGSKSAHDKQLESQIDAAKKQAAAAEQQTALVTQQATEAIEQARQMYSSEYATAKAQEDARAKANAELQYQLKTNPEYMAQQQRNYVILGGCALLAAVLLMRRK